MLHEMLKMAFDATHPSYRFIRLGLRCLFAKVQARMDPGKIFRAFNRIASSFPDQSPAIAKVALHDNVTFLAIILYRHRECSHGLNTVRVVVKLLAFYTTSVFAVYNIP